MSFTIIKKHKLTDDNKLADIRSLTNEIAAKCTRASEELVSVEQSTPFIPGSAANLIFKRILIFY